MALWAVGGAATAASAMTEHRGQPPIWVTPLARHNIEPSPESFLDREEEDAKKPKRMMETEVDARGNIHRTKSGANHAQPILPDSTASSSSSAMEEDVATDTAKAGCGDGGNGANGCGDGGTGTGTGGTGQQKANRRAGCGDGTNGANCGDPPGTGTGTGQHSFVGPYSFVEKEVKHTIKPIHSPLNRVKFKSKWGFSRVLVLGLI